MTTDGFCTTVKCGADFRAKCFKELSNTESHPLSITKQANDPHLLIFSEMAGCCLLYTLKDDTLTKVWGNDFFSKETHAMERAFWKSWFWKCFNHDVILLQKKKKRCECAIYKLKSAKLKNLETEFCQPLKNLPNEEIRCVLDPLVKNIKMGLLAICKIIHWH